MCRHDNGGGVEVAGHLADILTHGGDCILSGEREGGSKAASVGVRGEGTPILYMLNTLSAYIWHTPQRPACLPACLPAHLQSPLAPACVYSAMTSNVYLAPAASTKAVKRPICVPPCMRNGGNQPGARRNEHGQTPLTTPHLLLFPGPPPPPPHTHTPKHLLLFPVLLLCLPPTACFQVVYSVSRTSLSPPHTHTPNHLLLFPGSLLHLSHLLGAGVRRGGAAHEARVHLEGADEAPVKEAGDDVAQVNGVACRWPYGVDKCEPQSQDWRQGMMWRR